MKLSQTKRAKAMRKMRRTESKLAKATRLAIRNLELQRWWLRSGGPLKRGDLKLLKLIKFNLEQLNRLYKSLSRKERGLD